MKATFTSIPHRVKRTRHAAPILWSAAWRANPNQGVENQERLGNHNAISRSADSTESDPCTRFC